MVAIVYQATNRVNGKRYIGITSRSLKQRVSEHQYEARSKRSRCPFFHRAMAKYGPEEFSFSLLVVLPDLRSACDLERRLIAGWKPEYNITEGGEGSTGKRSPEIRARQSANSHRRGKPSPFRGRTHTAETKAAMAARRVGWKPPPEQAAIFRLAMLEAAARRRKPVICTTTNQRFGSTAAASEYHGWKPYVVANAISKQRGMTRGFHFQFEPTA